MLVSDLIKRIPSDTKKKVGKANQRHNQRVRDAIRSATRLKLTALSSDLEEGRRRGATVRVSVDQVGYPQEFEHQRIPDDFRLAALLALKRSHLIMLRDSARNIGKLLDNTAGANDTEIQDLVFKMYPAIRQKAPSISDSFEIAELLLAESSRYNLVEELFKIINEDILGHYFYGGLQSHRGQLGLIGQGPPPTGAKIVLYWGVIGLVAEAINVEVEDLTVVVMAHELAHAYTHLGFDSDNCNWDTNSFHQSDRAVVEGLAQYYTEAAAKALMNRIPGVYRAYERLLEKQPPAYHTQKEWINQTTSEAIRTSLITLRKSNPIKLSQFAEKLADIGPQYE